MRHLHSIDLRVCALLLLVFISLAATGCRGQGAAGEPPALALLAGELPACEGPLVNYFDRGAIVPPGRDTGYDAAPERAVGAVFAQAFALGAEGDLRAMAELLDARARLPHPQNPGETVAAFAVCQDVDEGVVLFRPPMGSGLPVMAWRPGSARRFIVEAPHPWFETHTLDQGLEAFFEQGARALIVSGAHRCASGEQVACSGRTSVCGDVGAYRESDPAHNPESVFHAMHVALAEAYHTHFAISLHGVSHHEVVVSDGTELGAAAGGPIGAAALDLRDMLEGEAGVMSCNGVPGMVPSDRFCGTTNAQGRHLNEVDDVCLDSAGDTRHRFLHIEQPMHVRETAHLRQAVIARIFERLDPFGAH